MGKKKKAYEQEVSIVGLDEESVYSMIVMLIDRGFCVNVVGRCVTAHRTVEFDND